MVKSDMSPKRDLSPEYNQLAVVDIFYQSLVISSRIKIT